MVNVKTTDSTKELFRKEELEGLPIFSDVNYRSDGVYIVVEGCQQDINNLKFLAATDYTIYTKVIVTNEIVAKNPKLQFSKLHDGVVAITGKRRFLNNLKLS